MELVYVWSEQYGTIKNMELNLSDKFEIKHDGYYEKWTISKIENNRVYEYYCETEDIKFKLSNITCIVGENGSGKTTAIKCILTRFYNNLDTVTHGTFGLPWILLFWDEERFWCYGNVSDVAKNIEASTGYKVIDKTKNEFPMVAVHYTNAFSYYDYMNSDYQTVENKFYDLSFSNNLKHKENNLSEDNIISAHYRDTELQLRVLGNSNDFPIEISKLYIIPMVNDNVLVEKMLNSLMRCGRLLGENKCKRLVDIWENIRKNNLSHNQVVMRMVVFSLYNVLSHNMNKRDIKTANKVIRIFSELSRCIEKNNIVFFQVYVKEFILCIYQHDLEMLWHVYFNTIDYLIGNEVNYNNGIYSVTKSKYQGVIRLIRDYSIIEKYCGDFINFSWGMSTGEYAKFNLLSHLYDYSKIEDSKPMLLLLDEIDLYMHPRWQQSFIGELLHDLSDMFQNKEIQIVFTTHSPIFLSDMANNNVIYCKKDDTDHATFEKYYDKRTFGENIYNLYRNSFFMNADDMGVLGAISMYVIKSILKGITKKDCFEQKYSQWTSIVNLIGEPYIRNILLRRLEENYKQIKEDERKNLIQEFSKLNLEKQKELLKIYKENNNG